MVVKSLPSLWNMRLQAHGVTDPEEMKNDITNDLKISNPIAISSKTGYGIHKLKTIIGNHTHIVKLTN